MTPKSIVICGTLGLFSLAESLFLFLSVYGTRDLRMFSREKELKFTESVAKKSISTVLYYAEDFEV